MPKVDIPIPDKLQEALLNPPCIDLSLPPPKKLSISLPTGASFTSLANAGQNIPNDCSLTFSLMLQVMPLMGSMECVLKILKLLKPLSDAVTSPPPTPALIKEIAEAVADLAPCFAMLTPAGMIPFVRDILCLILSILRCVIGQLKTIGELLGGLSIQLESAKANNNTDLMQTLECAQENAVSAIGHSMQGLEPIMAIMDLAAPFMSIAGVSAIQMPALGSAADVEALNETVATLEEVVATVQDAVDLIGGCPS